MLENVGKLAMSSTINLKNFYRWELQVKLKKKRFNY